MSNQNLLPLGKKESSSAKGCTRFLAAIKGRSCICAALRPHMSYLLLYELSDLAVSRQKLSFPSNHDLAAGALTSHLPVPVRSCFKGRVTLVSPCDCQHRMRKQVDKLTLLMWIIYMNNKRLTLLLLYNRESPIKSK